MIHEINSSQSVTSVVVPGGGSAVDKKTAGEEGDLMLERNRVHLTPLHFENIYKHFEWNNDPELNRLESELPYEEESFHEFKIRFEQMCFRPLPDSRDFEIHSEDGTLIGLAYVTNISESNKHCAVGVTIGDRDYWGKGYGRESLELLLDYCFNERGMHRVSTETFEYNKSWRSLVRDAGFKREGVERDYLFRDGTFWDKEIYAMLEHEYRSRASGMAA